MARRIDAEAANRQIDDHLYLRRARSLGADANSSTSSHTRSPRTQSPYNGIAWPLPTQPSRGVAPPEPISGHAQP